jgi:DNA helicase-2/ATP-dependent DNA helicase PcrA
MIIKSGMHVKHNQFGTGKVQMVSGEGEKKQAVVVFDTVGKKQLLLKYAKLEII